MWGREGSRAFDQPVDFSMYTLMSAGSLEGMMINVA